MTALALVAALAASGRTECGRHRSPGGVRSAGGARRRWDHRRRRRTRGGRNRTIENARHDGLTVLDLSDDWLPYIFSEEPGKPQPMRSYLIDLENERFGGSAAYARAREDRHFEAFGISPSLNRCGDGSRIASATLPRAREGPVLEEAVAQERDSRGGAGEGPVLSAGSGTRQRRRRREARRRQRRNPCAPRQWLASRP